MNKKLLFFIAIITAMLAVGCTETGSDIEDAVDDFITESGTTDLGEVVYYPDNRVVELSTGRGSSNKTATITFSETNLTSENTIFIANISGSSYNDDNFSISASRNLIDNKVVNITVEVNNDSVQQETSIFKIVVENGDNDFVSEEIAILQYKHDDTLPLDLGVVSYYPEDKIVSVLSGIGNTLSHSCYISFSGHELLDANTLSIVDCNANFTVTAVRNSYNYNRVDLSVVVNNDANMDFSGSFKLFVENGDVDFTSDKITINQLQNPDLIPIDLGTASYMPSSKEIDVTAGLGNTPSQECYIVFSGHELLDANTLSIVDCSANFTVTASRNSYNYKRVDLSIKVNNDANTDLSGSFKLFVENGDSDFTSDIITINQLQNPDLTPIDLGTATYMPSSKEIDVVAGLGNTPSQECYIVFSGHELLDENTLSIVDCNANFTVTAARNSYNYNRVDISIKVNNSENTDLSGGFKLFVENGDSDFTSDIITINQLQNPDQIPIDLGTATYASDKIINILLKENSVTTEAKFITFSGHELLDENTISVVDTYGKTYDQSQVQIVATRNSTNKKCIDISATILNENISEGIIAFRVFVENGTQDFTSDEISLSVKKVETGLGDSDINPGTGF